jgi:hypothetical protein
MGEDQLFVRDLLDFVGHSHGIEIAIAERGIASA